MADLVQDASVRLTWSRVTVDTTEPTPAAISVSAYRLYLNGTALMDVPTTGSPSQTKDITGVPSGTNTFGIRAISDAGVEGELREVSLLTPSGIPQDPATFVVTPIQ